MDEHGGVRQMNPLVLAYIGGDSVYDLYVRTYIIHKQKGMVNELNKTAVGFVKAGSQAFAVRALNEFLTEEEKGMIRRGSQSKIYFRASERQHVGVPLRDRL